MASVVITVEHISKRFRIGAARQRPSTFAETVRRVAASPFDYLRMRLSTATEQETLWALKDVSFEVQEGEVLGIIGRNGAGKSTLLKILSRITDPTEGRAIIRGRVNSLLEVGVGFHRELTGRENIYMNAAIHGMKRAEINRKLDEIVAFAEVEKFLDTPVKFYSSGMYTRLAFAVAAHLDPDILLVDEVLAVGDSAFQRKCLGKMGELSSEGRTVLFVSHNLAVLSTLCARSLLLSSGRLVKMGVTSEVIADYMASSVAPVEPGASVGDEFCELISAEIVNARGERVIQVDIEEGFCIQMKYRIKKCVTGAVVPNYHVVGSAGMYAFVTMAPGVRHTPPGTYVAKCVIPPHFMNEGVFTIGVACTTVSDGNHRVNFFAQNMLCLNVRDRKIPDEHNYGLTFPIPGMVRPRLVWEIERRDA